MSLWFTGGAALAMIGCVRRFSESVLLEAHSGYMAHGTSEDKRNTRKERYFVTQRKLWSRVILKKKKNLGVWSDFSFSCSKQGLFIDGNCVLDPV